MDDRRLTYFISDLHLGAAHIDSDRGRERLVCRFLDSITPTARRLYLLGDILDYWFEYKTVAPRGYLRFFGTLARMADSGVEIIWFKGNHDIWLFDYLRDEIGITVIDGSESVTIDGSRFLLSHGDGLGRLKPSFRFIRSLFRNRFCQKLYSGIHPRWTIPFAHAWSADSRKSGATDISYERDIAPAVEPWAREYAAAHPDTDYIVIGHHHVMVDKLVGDHTRLIILGDWISNFSYGVFDGKNFELKQYASALRDFNNK